MNGQIVEIKGRNVVIAYHPEKGEPRLGEALLLTERGHRPKDGTGLVVQVIGYDSAGYPGDREAALAELLEAAIAERHEVVQGEPAMVDLKEIKLARCKIRKRVHDGRWMDWDGAIPSRNVVISPVEAATLLKNVLPANPGYPVTFAHYGDAELTLDARDLDKVNVLVGVKGSGKSHTAKLVLSNLVAHGAPCWVFDINKEFVALPGADTIRIGDNYRLALPEVGFPFLMAVIDDLNPLTDVSRGALDHNGPRFMEQEVKATSFATIEYLLEKAEQQRFHSNEMVNQAIETRLRMVARTGLFETNSKAERLGARFDRATAGGGFLVFDLAELRVGRLKALTRGLNRRLEAICEEERKTGRGQYPFVFFEEAHFYAAPEEILNLISRGRHLGLTTFFITNQPSELPDVVFRQLDNMVVTGLTHSADLRTIAKCSLSDEETLQSLAYSLGATQALIVGRATHSFPLVVEIGSLPAGYPTTGATRSYWDAAGGKSKRRKGQGPNGSSGPKL